MSRDQEVYAHLKERHAKARRISSMMLSMKDNGVTVKRQSSCKTFLILLFYFWSKHLIIFNFKCRHSTDKILIHILGTKIFTWAWRLSYGGSVNVVVVPNHQPWIPPTLTSMKSDVNKWVRIQNFFFQKSCRSKLNSHLLVLLKERAILRAQTLLTFFFAC